MTLIKKKKKKKVQSTKTFLTGKLRSASLYWPPKNECLKNARVGRGNYECEGCKGVFKQAELQADHINPVIDLELGFVDWNTYIGNLFCSVENFQALCKTCHIAKTMQEDAMRQYYRDIKKAEKKAIKDKLKADARAWAKENKSTQKAYHEMLKERDGQS